MHKFIFILLSTMFLTKTMAVEVDEDPLLAPARTKGTVVYARCILKLPVTAPEKAECKILYTIYINALAALNAPLPLVPSIDPDPYVWSRYDICRYETAHIVFGEQVTVPYCPTV